MEKTRPSSFMSLRLVSSLRLSFGTQCIGEALIAVGRSPETPVACIERATFSDQRVTYSTLHGIADQVELLEIRNPMVTVIGEVAEMVDEDLIAWAGERKDHFYSGEFGE